MSKMNELKDLLKEQEAFYATACLQLSVLNIQMDQLSKRYDAANSFGQKAFRYSLRMRMAILEGVRNMFYEFATCRACEINRLRQEILIEHAFSENGESIGVSYPLPGRYPIYLVANDNEDEDEEDADEDDYDEDAIIIEVSETSTESDISLDEVESPAA